MRRNVEGSRAPGQEGTNHADACGCARAGGTGGMEGEEAERKLKIRENTHASTTFHAATDISMDSAYGVAVRHAWDACSLVHSACPTCSGCVLSGAWCRVRACSCVGTQRAHTTTTGWIANTGPTFCHNPDPDRLCWGMCVCLLPLPLLVIMPSRADLPGSAGLDNTYSTPEDMKATNYPPIAGLQTENRCPVPSFCASAQNSTERR